MSLQQSSLADQLACLRTSAQAEGTTHGLRAALVSLLMALLARLFGRLEDIARAWESGQLPPPPPPRPTSVPATLPAAPRPAPRWSLAAWLAGFWPSASYERWPAEASSPALPLAPRPAATPRSRSRAATTSPVAQAPLSPSGTPPAARIHRPRQATSRHGAGACRACPSATLPARTASTCAAHARPHAARAPPCGPRAFSPDIGRR